MQDGVVNIDKPPGWTSHDVVAKIRGLLRLKKVGHAGTLDPEATGVLLICFGKGTKAVPFLMNTEKEYEVVLRLGEETDTEDATGKVVRACEVPAGLDGRIRETLESFVGTYDQIPPMYSAVKVKGVPLYRSARAGKTVERMPRSVTIREIRFNRIEGKDVYFSVVCSKGTYVRTLCADIGAKLGVGGHLLRLRRRRSGRFHVSDAIALSRFLELCSEGAWEREAHSLSDIFTDLPAVRIHDLYRKRVKHGAPFGREGVLEWDFFKKGAFLRLVDSEEVVVAVASAILNRDEIKNSKEVFFKIETVLTEIDSEIDSKVKRVPTPLSI